VHIYYLNSIQVYSIVGHNFISFKSLLSKMVSVILSFGLNVAKRPDDL